MKKLTLIEINEKCEALAANRMKQLSRVEVIHDKAVAKLLAQARISNPYKSGKEVHYSREDCKATIAHSFPEYDFCRCKIHYNMVLLLEKNNAAEYAITTSDYVKLEN